MSSRLFVEIRERRGLTYGIDAGETAYSDAGLWSVEWQCAPGKLVQILELVRSTLAEIAAHGITEEELARAKGQMWGQTALSYEGPGSRMSRLGVNAVLGDERTLGELLRCFDHVTAEQVRAIPRHLQSREPVRRPGESSQSCPGGRTELSESQLAIACWGPDQVGRWRA
jgi:predicted Zn-dependent peptidase